jgi:hypothetical protein
MIPPTVSSLYSGILSSSSPTFTRPNSNTGYYYYQAIQVTVSTAGRYTFASTSSMDTYGCLYSDSFDPSSPSQNIITSDDDGDGGSQFRINVTLQSGRIYVLVVTTFGASTAGTFTITAVGSGSANMIPVTLTTTKPTTSWWTITRTSE